MSVLKELNYIFCLEYFNVHFIWLSKFSCLAETCFRGYILVYTGWFISLLYFVGTYEFMTKGNPQNPQILILPWTIMISQLVDFTKDSHLPALLPSLVSFLEVRPLSMGQYSSAAAKHLDLLWSYKPASLPIA